MSLFSVHDLLCARLGKIVGCIAVSIFIVLSSGARASLPLSSSVLALERDGQGEGWFSGLSLAVQGQDYFAGTGLGFREQAEARWGSVSGRLTRGWGSGSSFVFVDVGSTFSQGENFNYLLPYQVFYQHRDRSQLWSWSVGRMRHRWSSADAFWKQGIWEPRAFHEKLHPESLGLTGLWVNLKLSDWKLGLWGSPVFIPEIGPHQMLEGERFVSSNPWFRPPEEQLIFNGVPASVHYDLVRPDNADIIFNPGLAIHLENRDWIQGVLLKAAYALKPMNQLLMGFPVSFRLEASEGQQGGVFLPIHPRVLYHQLLSFEAAMTSQMGGTSWVNLTHEIPQPESEQEFWIHKAMQPSWILSGYSELDLSATGWGGLSAYGSFLFLEGGDAPDMGTLATGGGSRFERRYQYQRALSLGVKWADAGRFASTSGLRTARLLTDQRLTYEAAQRMWWWSLRWDLILDQAWSLLLQADVLALRDQRPAEVSDGFLRDYRANDRIVAGVSYVF